MSENQEENPTTERGGTPAARSVPASAILRIRKTWIIPALLAGTLIALITVIYVGSVVNPTAHLSGLPVSVVDQDTGATANGQQVTLGADVVSSLRGSPKVTKPLALETSTLGQAQHRMDTGGAYATIVIPAGFTRSVLARYGLAPATGTVPLPTITILTNQRAGTLGTSLATGVAEPALAAVMSQILTKIAATASPPTSALDRSIRADPVQVTAQTYRPLPDHSALGLSAFYIALLTIMCGFLGATLTNSSIDSATGFAPTELGPKWRLRRPLPMTRRQTLLAKWAVVAALAPVLDAVMLAVAVGALRLHAPHVLLLWLFTSFAAIVVGLGTLVLFALFGSLGQLVGMLVFLYLSLASSGGTIPIQALPEPLQWAADIEPLRQVLGGVRAIIYFNVSGAAGLTRGLIMTSVGLVFWLLAGLTVTRLYDRRGLARISPEILAYVNQAIEQAPRLGTPAASMSGNAAAASRSTPD